MAETTYRPCCGRLQGKLTVLRGDVARATRTAIRADEKGRRTQRHLDEIDKAKRALAMAQENFIDHEAEHAGESG